MPKERGKALPAAATDCDRCMQKLGRNKQIVHFLSHEDEDDLKRHLQIVFAGDELRMKPHLQFYSFVQRMYGLEANRKYFPLWLVYLEATGTKVVNRADAIIKYRQKYSPRAALPAPEKSHA